MRTTVQLSSRQSTFERTNHFQDRPLNFFWYWLFKARKYKLFQIYFRNWLIFVEKLKPGEELKVKEEKQSLQTSCGRKKKLTLSLKKSEIQKLKVSSLIGYYDYQSDANVLFKLRYMLQFSQFTWTDCVNYTVSFCDYQMALSLKFLEIFHQLHFFLMWKLLWWDAKPILKSLQNGKS